MAQSEIERIRALLSSKPRPVGWLERRKRLDDVGSVWPVAEDVALTAADVNGLPGEWSIAPGSDRSRVLMFFHGGGYCSGSIVSHRRLVTEAGRAAGVRTLAIGYRLAPEHPFPAAYDDVLTAWRFLRNQNIPAAHIAIGGDSAGAGLTIALITRLRDAHEELPGCGWLISPWTDLTISGSTVFTRDAVDPLIHKQYLIELADAYLPAGMDRKDPRVSPLYADLKGFPPALIQVGSAETLLDDATRFAAVAGAADVRVTLEIWPYGTLILSPAAAHLRVPARLSGRIFEAQRRSDPRSYNKPRLRKSPRLPPEERSTRSIVNLSRHTSQASSTP